MSRTYTQTQYDNLDRRRKTAWAKYYQLEAEQSQNATVIIRTIGRNDTGGLIDKSTLPTHITSEFYEMAEQLNKKYTCPVCLDLVNKENIEITYCGHIYHKECLEQSKRVKMECPTCRKKLF
ncbi:MAG: RING finger domain-containing protein [Flavobacterium sp.]|jgi:hypothetical protein|uniref:RING finger domain-containing protein n=1 Tax=Flavobacterium sp. TaxID=239 RepID=UPI003BC846A9